MFRTITLLAIAAVSGVITATTSACFVGLTQGTGTWCGLPFVWPIGFIFAIPIAILFGLPAEFIYRKLGLRRWWQFVLGGVVLSLPVWHSLAEPFHSVRWQASGFFDTLNYVGSGAFGGLAYWRLRTRRHTREETELPSH